MENYIWLRGWLFFLNLFWKFRDPDHGVDIKNTTLISKETSFYGVIDMCIYTPKNQFWGDILGLAVKSLVTFLPKLLLMVCGTTSFSRIWSGSRCSVLFMWKWTNVYEEWQIKLLMIPNLCHFNTRSILYCKILTKQGCI